MNDKLEFKILDESKLFHDQVLFSTFEFQTLKHAWAASCTKDTCLAVYEIFTGNRIKAFDGITDLEEWYDGFLDTSVETSDPINPPHYQNFVLDLQWMEAEQYRSKEFEAAIESHVHKYLDRLGQKDDELKELRKTFWYLGFWIAYKANGCEPIRVRDIPRLIDLENIWKGA
jgi:hypothetical protein